MAEVEQLAAETRANLHAELDEAIAKAAEVAASELKEMEERWQGR